MVSTPFQIQREHIEHCDALESQDEGKYALIIQGTWQLFDSAQEAEATRQHILSLPPLPVVDEVEVKHCPECGVFGLQFSHTVSGTQRDGNDIDIDIWQCQECDYIEGD